MYVSVIWYARRSAAGLGAGRFAAWAPTQPPLRCPAMWCPRATDRDSQPGT